MAIFHIEEHNGLLSTNAGDSPAIGGNIAQAVKQPGLTTQVVDYGAATSSNAFSAATNLIRISTLVDCYYVVGAGPTATANSSLLPAGGVEYFGVNAGDKISVYDGTT